MSQKRSTRKVGLVNNPKKVQAVVRRSTMLAGKIMHLWTIAELLATNRIKLFQ